MRRFGLMFLTGSVITFATLTSCAASPDSSYSDTSAPIAVDSVAQSPLDESVGGEAAEATSAANAELEKADGGTENRPQLIKRANLSLDVESVEESFGRIRAIVSANSGDVLEMQDYGDRERSINFTLRVPQENLDATLDELTALGEVRGRSIETDDVSSQLVDLQARISNARKSEEALQEIMSRSGEIADVLEVSRELSSVRQEIETMSAMQKKLQTQVRYSTIRLSVQSAITLTPSKPGFSTQVATSWNEATDSVGEFTTDLVQLGLWLLVYTPYLALLACGIILANKLRKAASS